MVDPNEEPVAVPVMANATVPVGVETGPALPGPSTTVAVHVEVAAKLTVDGAHDTVVLVVRSLTTMIADIVVALPLWAPSVGVLKEAEIVNVPAAVNVNVTLQLAVPITPGERPQLGARLPGMLETKTTPPPGVTGPPAAEVSDTEALHVEGAFTGTGVSQVIDVEVVRRLTVMLAEIVVELPLCVSPVAGTYVADMLAVPAVEGVKVEAHVASPAVAVPVRVHGLPAKAPLTPV